MSLCYNHGNKTICIYEAVIIRNKSSTSKGACIWQAISMLKQSGCSKKKMGDGTTVVIFITYVRYSFQVLCAQRSKVKASAHLFKLPCIIVVSINIKGINIRLH